MVCAIPMFAWSVGPHVGRLGMAPQPTRNQRELEVGKLTDRGVYKRALWVTPLLDLDTAFRYVHREY